MSSIGTIGSSNTLMHGMGARRPDPAAMAEKLFSRLDTDNQGYIEQADLETAFGKIDGTGESTDAAAVFAQLDGDSDGKVTKDELSTALSAVAEQLDSQFAEMRMREGMPPPPPQDDAGFTKDQLQGQLDEIDSSDSQRAELIADIVGNFDAADADGDGKVSFSEAMAYQEDQSSGNATAASASTTEKSTTNDQSERQLMMQIMRLVQAYDPNGANDRATSTIATAA